MVKMLRYGVLWLGLVACAGAVRSEAMTSGGSGLSPELRSRFEASLARGGEYLRHTREADGSWSHDPGVTSLAVLALLGDPSRSLDQRRADIAPSLAYVAGFAKPDGGIYQRDMPNYYTAVAVLAFVEAGTPEYRPLVARAQEFLLRHQADEGEGYTPADKFYGGIGYGADLRPDIANLEYGLQALRASGLAPDNPAWEKAIRFLERSQNRSESNDQKWAGNDGGFVYYPGFSYGGDGKGTQSYGSMTYAGLLSFSWSRVGKDDPRVAAAFEWIRSHYTVDENPGMGQKTVYYYYMVFAKALRALGVDVVSDAQGVRHDWRVDLGTKLVALQHEEGYWVNPDPAWWQDNKALVTAFTLQALADVLGR